MQKNLFMVFKNNIVYAIIWQKCCLSKKVLLFKKRKGATVVVLAEKLRAESPAKSKFNDEFQAYLKQQCLKTTFNGVELETFSWYRKVLGLV